jgi:hypothetical protein
MLRDCFSFAKTLPSDVLRLHIEIEDSLADALTHVARALAVRSFGFGTSPRNDKRQQFSLSAS